MNFFNIIIILIVLSSIFGYINARFLKLPDTIGLMIISTVFSIIMILINYLNPQLFHFAEDFVANIDFSKVLLNVMLSFLLFAGALHTDGSLLRKQKGTILLFSIVGVLLSTFFIASLLYSIAGLIGYQLDYIYCLLFGALISPTDPIAVLGILTKANVPKKIEINIVGESLLNDGIGVVLFITILDILRGGPNELSFGKVILLFLQEAVGGIMFGFAIGYIAYRLLKSIDNYQVEVMITLSMVMGGYYLASLLHVSGPLAMVVAGLFTGSRSKELAMSDTSAQYVGKFWELMDGIMNAILFILIGLRLMVLNYNNNYLPIAFAAIPIVLFSRYFSIALPVLILRKRIDFSRKDQLLMTWGGLRGGLSIAMALSLASEPNKDLIVFITYVIVLFSVVVQGLTVGGFAQGLYAKKDNSNTNR